MESEYFNVNGYRCPQCGAPEVSPGEFKCGTVQRRSWYGLKRYAHSDKCDRARRCADAGMVLILDAINRSAQCLNHQWADLVGPNGIRLGDWVITVTKKSSSRKPSNQRKRERKRERKLGGGFLRQWKSDVEGEVSK